MIRIFFSFLFLLFTFFTSAQHLMEWGIIPKEDFQMTSYAPDTSAEAVVLGENGFFKTFQLNYYSGSNPLVNFKVHRRIKILKNSGFDRTNIKINYYAKDNYQKLLNIRAQIFSPSGEKVVLSSKNIVEEDITKSIKVEKIIFPNVEIGSIIEYEYELQLKNYTELPDWYFQEDIPIRHSYLHLDAYNHLNYKFYFFGKVNLNKSDPLFTTDNRTLVAFFADTVPTISNEPFTASKNEYYAKVRLNCSTWSTINWTFIASNILNESNMGVFYNNKDIDKKKSVKPNEKMPLDIYNKIKFIYDFINKSLSWDDQFRWYTYKKPDEVLKSKSVSSGELNWLLLHLLRNENIEAFPFLISTRSNGKASDLIVSTSQFDHIIVGVKINSDTLFLDAGSKYLPIGFPKIESLNSVACQIYKNKEQVNAQWVKLKAPTDSLSIKQAYSLTGDGTLKGKIEHWCKGYSAYNERKTYFESNSTDYIKRTWAKNYLEIQIDSIQFINLDKIHEPLTEIISCTIPNALQASDSLFYFKPTFDFKWEENPFKQETRMYPIDLPYPKVEKYHLTVSLPSNLKIEDLPENTMQYLYKNKGYFSYKITKSQNNISIDVEITLQKVFFEPYEYIGLKLFYSKIVSKLQEQIILRKIP